MPLGFTPLPSILPTTGMVKAAKSAPGIINSPVCVAVQPSEICTNKGKMKTEFLKYVEL